MSRSIITQSARAATRNNVIRTTALARPFSTSNQLASDPNFQYPTSFASGSSKPSQSPSGPVMPWSEYLSYRKSKRIWTTAASVPSTLTGLGVGAAYFASIEADPTQLIFGLEPMLVYGGATFACMALGYLLGPTLGSSLFALAHPKLHKGNPSPIELMDREFFRRIAKNRGDPRFQSVQNPAPDFYGEKIVSIPTYRRWLRDQAVYKRKAQHGVPAEEQ